MEKGVQHNPTTQLTWIPAASARNNQVEAGRRTNIASGTGLWRRSVAPDPPPVPAVPEPVPPPNEAPGAEIELLPVHEG
jgi:hypothetical protein